MCDYDGTGPKRLNPGDSFSVTSSSENVNLEAFYTEAPGPGPEPGPTPTPTPDPGSNTGSLTSSPTTGDTTNTGLVSLALLAVIAGIIYIVYRKRILNY